MSKERFLNENKPRYNVRQGFGVDIDTVEDMGEYFLQQEYGDKLLREFGFKVKNYRKS